MNEFPEIEPPRTDAELSRMREQAIADYSEMGWPIEAFTCDDCGFRHKCPLVFDAYNTDGDCLMDK